MLRRPPLRWFWRPGTAPHDEVPDQVNAALLQWLEGLKSAAAPTNADLLAK